MITGRDILYISSIEWDFLWQAHQEIAGRLAAAGNRVFYIDNLGVRSPRLSDANRVAGRLKRWLTSRRSRGAREVISNVYVCSPLVLPPFGSGWRRQLNRRFFLRRLKKDAQAMGLRNPIIWTYLPTDTVEDLIQLFRPTASLVIYHCVADFSQLTPEVEKLHASERALLLTSDIVFASCSQLARGAAELNSNVHLISHGVNLQAFPLPDGAATETACPAELAALPRPAIGYVGGLHRHVDLDLVKEMILRKPEWSWVFVGSVQVPLGSLADLPNAKFIGPRPHSELVNYIRNFDVCIVPYVNSAATATVVPTKINEYLAVGKPIVSTAIPAVREFNERERVLALSSNTSDDFLAAIEEALQSANEPSQVSRRRAVAAAAGWSLRLEEISEILEKHLGQDPPR